MTKTLWSRTWGHLTVSLEFKGADKWGGVYGPVTDETGTHTWICFPLPLLPWHIHWHPQWSGNAVRLSPERTYREIGAIEILDEIRGPGRWVPDATTAHPTTGDSRDRAFWSELRRSLESQSERQAMLERLIYAIHQDAGEMEGLGPAMSNGVLFEAMALASVPFARSDNIYEEEWSYRLDREWLKKMREREGY